jgi:pimeloyl-ACP methyl ester carboxylesterase
VTRPIVLVPGFATSAARTWGGNGWYDILGDMGRQVVGVDLLGHGDADKPIEVAAYDELEEELLGRMPDEPVDAIGFSLGARSLLVAACRHPERFHSLVLAGVGLNILQPEGPEHFAKVADAVQGRGDLEDPTLRYFSVLGRAPDQDPAALAALVQRRRTDIADERLDQITMPVLVVIGDRDRVGPAEPLVELLPTAELVVLKGVDHAATPKSVAFVDAVVDFLERVGS